MKCTGCGNNINLELPFCPYCGRPNDQAKKHVEDMQKYKNEFERTQSEVLENSKKFSSFTIKTAIIAILVALIAIVAVGFSRYYEMSDSIRQRRIEKDADEYTQMLDEYIADRDYEGLYFYMRVNGLGSSNAFSSYYPLYSSGLDYYHMKSALYDLYFNADRSHYDPEESYEQIARYVLRFKSELDEMEDTEAYSYKPENYEGRKGEYLLDMKQDIQDLIQVNFNLTDEEAQGMWELTEAKLTVLLEEKFDAGQ